MAGSCTVVIPTYNEEKNIVNMAKAIRELYPDFKIMFMDDNSTDRSKELIDGLGDPNTVLVTRNPEERGLAASVFQGILECGTDYFMTIDCDFQHPPEALGRMYAEMEKGVDLCIGCREDRLALGFVRWAGSWVFNIFADTYLFFHGSKTSRDVMSGLIAGRTDRFVPVIKENWDELEMQGWKVLLDLLKFSGRDLKIANVEYKFGKRAEGESHINPRVTVSTFNQCGRFGRWCGRLYARIRKCRGGPGGAPKKKGAGPAGPAWILSSRSRARSRTSGPARWRSRGTSRGSSRRPRRSCRRPRPCRRSS